MIFRWSTNVTSGTVGENDLSEFSLEVYESSAGGACAANASSCRQIYYDQIITRGVIQLLPGVTRTAADPLWDFDLDTSTLLQFRNVGFSTVTSTNGTHFLVTDSLTLPEDDVVALFKYLNGAEVGSLN